MSLNPSQIANEKRRLLHHEADVVVVGAGIFGCAAAFAFANQGRSVLLLERSLEEPRRIVGELLQPGGLSALQKLGLGDCVKGIDSVRVDGYQIIYHGTPVDIPYPENEHSKRPVGTSFHHGRFISQLRRACASQPNITIVETEVTDTITSTCNLQVLGVKSRTTNLETSDKKEDYYFGDLTIIADGYASKFRKQYIKRAPVVKSKFYALELIDCPLTAPNHGIVILGSHAPVLLYQIASTKAGGVRSYFRKIVLPSLPLQMQPCFEKALEDDKIPPSMPNSFLPPSTQGEKGMAILGDAMNMRHPLTGGGMTVAFNDVVLLSDLLSPQRVPSFADTAAVQKAMKDFHWKRKGLSTTINILAMALYSLFAANDRQLEALKSGTFAYLARGGNCRDGPCSLLGGIIKQPFLLSYHFFAVALFSLWMVMRETIGSVLGFWKFPLAIKESVLVFWRACVVICPYIFSEMRP
ncbi:putative squalene monooxygenase [Lachnellula subtilissima]|uniref:Squalene monooxygenase n=1 Tax=Lachnellula subtilissima TaxID=602034 RepID=A0A8H8RDQ2_9HELO|nr:putative squalene monooxygenase [Lachnellula subtilissima]